MKKTILIILILILNIFLVSAQSEETNIVLVIDISASTQDYFLIEKNLALNIVDSLSEKNNVGIITFGYTPCHAVVISELKPLRETKNELKDKISRLKFDGQSCFDIGVQSGYELLSKASGSKNIIFISDGRTIYQKLKDDTLGSVRNINSKGVKVFTVGIGTNEDDDIFLNNMAALGEGKYYKTDAPKELKVQFGDNCECEQGYTCQANQCVEEIVCGDNKCSSDEICLKDSCCYGNKVDFGNDNDNCGTCWNPCIENYICEQAKCVINTKEDLSYYPQFFIKDNKVNVVIVVGDKAPSSHVIAQTQIMLALSDYIFRRGGIPEKGNTKLASEINDIEDFNIISLGNACVNPVSAKILGNPQSCNNLKPGEATIEIYKSRTNKAHIVLNAYSDEGVKKAADVLSRYQNYNFKGNKFTIEVEEKKVDNEIIDNKTSTEKFIEMENFTKINNNESVENEIQSLEIKNEIRKEQENFENKSMEDKSSKQIAKEPTIINKFISWFLSLFKPR